MKLNANFEPTEKSFNITLNENGSTVIIKDHNILINRDLENQHPIKAISGLQQKLDDIGDIQSLEAITNEDIEQIINTFK